MSELNRYPSVRQKARWVQNTQKKWCSLLECRPTHKSCVCETKKRPVLLRCFRTYAWKMAAVPGYSYEHPFALDQMFPQANPIIRESYNSEHRSHRSYFRSVRFPEITMTSKRLQTIRKAIMPHMTHYILTFRYCQCATNLRSCSIAVNAPCFPTRKKR